MYGNPISFVLLQVTCFVDVGLYEFLLELVFHRADCIPSFIQFLAVYNYELLWKPKELQFCPTVSLVAVHVHNLSLTSLQLLWSTQQVD